MKTNEQLMKACQIGCNNLNDANNLLAECYGRIGKIAEENERLRKDAERLDELDIIAQREEGADMHLAHGHIALYLRTGIGSNAHGVRGSDIRKVIDAARGAK